MPSPKQGEGIFLFEFDSFFHSTSAHFISLSESAAADLLEAFIPRLAK